MRAGDVSVNGREVSGQVVENDEWIYPCLGTLPMGFCWSLYFAQSVNEHALHEVKRIQDVSVMNDRTQPCVLDISNSGRVFGLSVSTTLVDSLWISAVHREGLRHLKTSSMRWGCEPSLGIHVQTTPGHVLDCRQHVTKTSPARWWRLHQGLGALLKRNAVTGAFVENISRLVHLCLFVPSVEALEPLTRCGARWGSNFPSSATLWCIWNRGGADSGTPW